MSTVAERVRLAFNAVTGENGAPSGNWLAVNSTHSLEVRNIPGTRRREAIAQVVAKDSQNVNGWHVSPITAPLTGGGLTASKDGNEVQVYANGDARGYDDVAVRFAKDAFEVALERAQAS